jgi:hypothetical protein
MKKGKFSFRLWFIKKLVESLMKSKIDEYVGSTIIGHRIKNEITYGYAITDDLLEALSSVHSIIKKQERN